MAERAHDRLVRMLGLVAYLDRHDRVPVGELARHFGVTEGQIVADIELLWVSGTPGYLHDDLLDFDAYEFEQGQVTIRADRGLRRPLRLGTREAVVLLAALDGLRALVEQGLAPDVGPILDGLVGKLQLASGQQTPLDVQLDPDGSEQVRRALGDALARSRRVRVTYVNASDVASQREIDPHRVFTDQGATYLQGWCLRAGGERTFRLDRILDAEVLDTAVEHPTPARLPSSIALDARDAVVELELDARARWVAEQMSVDEVIDLDDGGFRIRFRVADGAWLRSLLLSEARWIRTVDPPSAAEPAAAAARAALAEYARLDP